MTVVALSAAGSSPDSAASAAVSPTAVVVPTAPPTTDLPLNTDDGAISTAAPGQSLTMVGDGYAPFSTVTLAVYSTPTVLGTVMADENGAFETTVDVPDNLSLGAHSFVAAGVDPDGNFRALRLDLTVAPTSEGTGGGGSLPITGPAVFWAVMTGFGMVLAGLVLRRVRR